MLIKQMVPKQMVQCKFNESPAWKQKAMRCGTSYVLSFYVMLEVFSIPLPHVILALFLILIPCMMLFHAGFAWYLYANQVDFRANSGQSWKEYQTQLMTEIMLCTFGFSIWMMYHLGG